MQYLFLKIKLTSIKKYPTLKCFLENICLIGLVGISVRYFKSNIIRRRLINKRREVTMTTKREITRYISFIIIKERLTKRSQSCCHGLALTV